jgi:hypothetical protein
MLSVNVVRSTFGIYEVGGGTETPRRVDTQISNLTAKNVFPQQPIPQILCCALTRGVHDLSETDSVPGGFSVNNTGLALRSAETSE